MRRFLLSALVVSPLLLAACGHDDRPIVVNPQPVAVTPQPQPSVVTTTPPGGTVVVPPGTRVCTTGSYC